MKDIQDQLDNPDHEPGHVISNGAAGDFNVIGVRHEEFPLLSHIGIDSLNRLWAQVGNTLTLISPALIRPKRGEDNEPIGLPKD